MISDLQTFVNLNLGNLWQLFNEIRKCTPCKVDIFWHRMASTCCYKLPQTYNKLPKTVSVTFGLFSALVWTKDDQPLRWYLRKPAMLEFLIYSLFLCTALVCAVSMSHEEILALYLSACTLPRVFKHSFTALMRDPAVHRSVDVI